MNGCRIQLHTLHGEKDPVTVTTGEDEPPHVPDGNPWEVEHGIRAAAHRGKEDRRLNSSSRKKRGSAERSRDSGRSLFTALAVAMSLFAIYSTVFPVTTQILRGVHVVVHADALVPLLSDLKEIQEQGQPHRRRPFSVGARAPFCTCLRISRNSSTGPSHPSSGT